MLPAQPLGEVFIDTNKLAKAKRKRSWPNVYSRKHRSGQAGYIVELGLVNGKRERHSFKTKAEVDTLVELKKTERQNQGVAALAPPQEIKVDAAKAGELLTPHGVSLQEAAKDELRYVIACRIRIGAPNDRLILPPRS